MGMLLLLSSSLGVEDIAVTLAIGTAFVICDDDDDEHDDAADDADTVARGVGPVAAAIAAAASHSRLSLSFKDLDTKCDPTAAPNSNPKGPEGRIWIIDRVIE